MLRAIPYGHTLLTTSMRVSNMKARRELGRAPAVSTYRELRLSAETTPDTIDVLAPDLPAAEALATRLADLPEVAGAMTLASWATVLSPARALG